MSEKKIFVDSHCHLNLIVKKDFDTRLTDENIVEAENLIKELREKNINIVNVGTSLIESENCLELANISDMVKAVIGIHPCDINENWSDEIDTIEDYLKNSEYKDKIVGIGECGFDKYHEPYDISLQETVFKKQIELAVKYNKALIIHSRDAADETLKVLKEYKDSLKKVIVHCFSYDTEFAKQVVSWGFKLGIGGPITYPKNEYLREIVKTVGLQNIVLETDAPYLTPQKYRGEPNTPLYIPLIAEYIANLLNCSIDEVADITTQNCTELFNG